MGRATNRVFYAALSQAVDDSITSPEDWRPGSFVGQALIRLRTRTEGRPYAAAVQQLAARIHNCTNGNQAWLQEQLADMFVLYEEGHLGTIAVLLTNQPVADYFPNFLDRYRELFGVDPPPMPELGAFAPVVPLPETHANPDIARLFREMSRLGLEPRTLSQALFQIPDDVVDPNLNRLQNARSVGDTVRNHLISQNLNQLPRQQQSRLPDNLANIDWDRIDVADIPPGELYDKVVDFVRNANRLYGHYGKARHPLMSPQVWLSQQTYFRALVAMTGRRGQTLPRDVMSFIRTNLLRRGVTASVPAATSTAPEATYANPELAGEQAGDLSAMAGIRPVATTITNRNQRQVQI